MTENVVKHDWGLEAIWAAGESYIGKILVFNNKGSKTSMHFHKETEKTYFVSGGAFLIRWIDTKTGQPYAKEFMEGETFHNPVHQPCQLEALVKESTLTVVSNKHADDICHVIPANHIGGEEVVTKTVSE